MSPIYITKADGDKEIFSPEKVYYSAKRAGADDILAKEITKKISKQIYPGARTSDIFNKIKQQLKKDSPGAYLRFNLKEGIKKLGPTGFPFEKFIAELLGKLNFKVKINQHIPGHCLTDYEIDFIARKGKAVYIGECKYRNLPGEKVHSKDALTNYARFLDIKNGPYFEKLQRQRLQLKTILITNTKFTDNARGYSTCMGVDLLGWKCPKNNGLEYLIDKYKLYPVTVLPLRRYLKDIFVSEQIMLVKNILEIDPGKFSKKFKIPIKYLNSLISDAKSILED